MSDISRSRAMAVAAHEEKVYVYALKSRGEMRREFREESRLEPIKQVGILSFSFLRNRLMTVSLSGSADRA